MMNENPLRKEPWRLDTLTNVLHELYDALTLKELSLATKLQYHNAFHYLHKELLIHPDATIAEYSYFTNLWEDYLNR